jgi:DNA-binding winged helix-turn-helix (wHTH) protein
VKGVPSAELESVRIGSVEIRPRAREIDGPGGLVTVEPRVMQVLVVLVAAAGRVVTRDELIEQCWGGRAVSEDAINRTIQRIRGVAKGVAAGSFTIKTVHKTGYRLVETVSAGLGPPGLTDGPPAMTRRVLPKALLASGLVAAGGAGLVFVESRRRAHQRVRALIAKSDLAVRTGYPDADRQGAVYLEEAVKLEPRNAAAWGRLALARTHVAEYAPPERAAAAVAGAQEAANTALALSPRQAEAMAALAILPPYYGDWWNAEQRMRRVLRIHPGHLPTRDALNFMLSAIGRGIEGSRDRVVMVAQDPLNAVYQFRLIYAQWLLGDIQAADRAADRALQLWPGLAAAWLARLWILAFTGRAERAMAHLADTHARPGLPTWMIRSLEVSIGALISRRPKDVSQASDLLIGQVSRSPSSAVNAVMLLAGMRELDLAFEVAEAYLLERGRLMASVDWRPGQPSVNDLHRRLTNMLFIPPTAVMRADPRFEGLVRDIGLTSYWERAGVIPDYKQAKGVA